MKHKYNGYREDEMGRFFHMQLYTTPFNPSNILNGKYAKFLPIYKIFFRNFSVKVDSNIHIGLG